LAEICPSCGAPLDEAASRCPACGGATTRRLAVFSGPKAKLPSPAADMPFPWTISEARYTVGEVWTHGLLHLTDLGIYFLAESDGPWTPEKLVTATAPNPNAPHRVADLSFYVPMNQVEAIQHRQRTSFSVIIRGQHKPLRLTPEGWATMDAFAARVGIPSS